MDRMGLSGEVIQSLGGLGGWERDSEQSLRYPLDFLGARDWVGIASGILFFFAAGHLPLQHVQMCPSFLAHDSIGSFLG